MRSTLYILADLADRDLIWLHAAGALRTLRTGEILIAAGREVREMYFLLDGNLAVTSREGHRVATLTVGDVVGEMSFVEKRPPSVSVTAETSARVLAVPREAILARFVEDIAFCARFYRALAVFLSDRLRVATVGITDDDAGGEIDEGVLDGIHVAGDRFLRLVRLLQGQTA